MNSESPGISFELVDRKSDGRENIVQTYTRCADAEAGRDLLNDMGAKRRRIARRQVDNEAPGAALAWRNGGPLDPRRAGKIDDQPRFSEREQAESDSPDKAAGRRIGERFSQLGIGLEQIVGQVDDRPFGIGEKIGGNLAIPGDGNAETGQAAHLFDLRPASRRGGRHQRARDRLLPLAAKAGACRGQPQKEPSQG